MTVKTKNSYERLYRDMASGKIPVLAESGLLKKIRLKLEKEFENEQLLLDKHTRKMILHTLDFTQERMEKEAQKIEKNTGTFYRDVESEYALMIIEDISRQGETVEKALNMIELFVNNLMTVEEIEMVLY